MILKLSLEESSKRLPRDPAAGVDAAAWRQKYKTLINDPSHSDNVIADFLAKHKSATVKDHLASVDNLFSPTAWTSGLIAMGYYQRSVSSRFHGSQNSPLHRLRIVPAQEFGRYVDARIAHCQN